MLKRPRLASSPLNDMPVLDVMLSIATQAKQRLKPSLGIPQFKTLRIHANLDTLADQPTMHRVHILVNPNGTARPNVDMKPGTVIQPLQRQGVQHRQFLGQTMSATGIHLTEELSYKSVVRLTT